MGDTGEQVERRKRRIQEDLASFADPNTIVDVSRLGRSFRATWKARGQLQEETFPVYREMDAYRSLFAGPKLADLRGVARMILQSAEADDSEPLIATKAMPERADDAGAQEAPRASLDILTELLEDSEDATRIVMLTGAPGAGKTRVLKEVVRRQAESYLHGTTTKLLFYVNAQGRALSRLNEAFAAELHDLKVHLFYHSIAVLTRIGILVPVIDGFDELLGVSGYDDAFSSLGNFLEQIGGEGQLLVSARSVYYEEEFLARSARISASGDQAWKHVPVRVLNWNNDDRAEYLEKWMTGRNISPKEEENIRAKLAQIQSGPNSQLASRPLFYTRLVRLVHQKATFSEDGDLLHDIAVDYIARECNEKLLDRSSNPLLTESQYVRLMCELAEEMWNQDTRELDARSIREVAEYVVENEGLAGETKEVVIERMPTLAFLSQGEGAARRAGTFEHESFFFYFLGKAIASKILEMEGDMRIVLSRSPLPEDVADRVAIEIGNSDALSSESVRDFVGKLVEAARTEWTRSTQVKENSGILIMALFRRCGQVDDCVVRSVIFPGGSLSNVILRKCLLDNVVFRRTNLTETRFEDCDANDVLFIETRLKTASTWLNLRGVKVSQFLGIRDSENQIDYDPGVIAEKLVNCGAPIHKGSTAHFSVSPEYVKLIQRLMSAYRRANPIFVDDRRLAAIFNDSRWPILRHLLIEHGLIEREDRHPGGRPREVYRRRFLAEDLILGLSGEARVDQRIRNFWRSLEAESR